MWWKNKEKRKQKGQQAQPNVVNKWREKKANGFGRPNPIYGRKLITSSRKAIKMKSDFEKVMQVETMQSHSGKKHMKKQDKIKTDKKRVKRE